MSDLVALWQWQAELAKRLSGLSVAQVRVLGEWSLGMVLGRSCALTMVSLVWATANGEKPGTVRQRLREWYYAVEQKRGSKRQAVEVEPCFPALLAWIVGSWSGRQLALAMDATSLGEQFVVLAISVVYRGCAVPVAWSIVPAGQQRAWRPEWERLLGCLRGTVPADWTVIVLADRGLYARWLFTTIVGLGWHRPPQAAQQPLPLRPPGPLPHAPQFRAGHRPTLGRNRHGLQERHDPAALHPARLAWGRLQGPLADPDRPAARRG